MLEPAASRLGGARRCTHPAKVFWPDEGLTKLDLAQFYARIGSRILPWMKSRAITMERCPDGIRGQCFFQKQAPDNLPAGVPTVRIPALLFAATSTTSSAARARRC